MKLNFIKKLKCKYNNVYLASTENGGLVIHKSYANKADAFIETEILNKLSLSGYAPKVLERGDGFIIMEHLEGEPFIELYKKFTMFDDIANLEKLANELCIFLQIFYSMLDGFILDDLKFSNFFIKDNRCYGIDYDSVGEGLLYVDVASIVVEALIYGVGDVSSNYPFIRQVLKNFHLDMLDIINDISIKLSKINGIANGVIDKDIILNNLIHIDEYKNYHQS